MKTNKGFTLIEVIIAIVILTTITVLTARMIQSGLEFKKKIQGGIDRYSNSRDVLSLMSRDIGAAFNYRDMNVELFNAAQKNRIKNAEQGQQGGQAGQGQGQGGTGLSPEDAERFKEKEVLLYTRFIGESDNLHFTSLNNFRATSNAPVSNQAEIGYFLRNCRNRKDKNLTSQCLWRRTSPYLDKEVKEGGTEQAILENVKSLSLRYLTTGDTDDVWRESWSSIELESTVTKDNFPVAVEITLVTMDTKNKDKELALTVVAPIRFPNNPKRQEAPTDATN